MFSKVKQCKCQCSLLYNGYRGVLAGAWLRGVSSVVGGACVSLRESFCGTLSVSGVQTHARSCSSLRICALDPLMFLM